MIFIVLLACAPLVTVSPDAIQLNAPLAIEATGSRWRQPVHTDVLEHQIVEGQFTAPQPGDALQLTNGDTVTWQVIEPDADGRVEAPRGGYVFYQFESDTSYPALLDVRGHTLCYLNGEPRGGDVYNRGTLRLPFQVRQGTNELLLRSGRGPLQPVVRSAAAIAAAEMSSPGDRVVFIGQNDLTLPDLIQGEAADVRAAVLIYNVDPRPLKGATLHTRMGSKVRTTPIPPIEPMSFAKIPLTIGVDVPADASEVEVDVTLRQDGVLVDTEVITLSVKAPTDLHLRTFVSEIDGSVQYYAVRPAIPTSEDDPPPGIALSLHGASVEGRGQAACYQSRPWVHVVAPTNRRPFGFDWEHWGRRDAMEVLQDAAARYDNDPSRRWLTGHSMGGHGTWQLGSTFPDQWAAIAPSAGWISFWTYGGPPRYERDGGIREVLYRAANPSDTLLLKDNLEDLGIYVLHGDADGNVPVEQARLMRRELATFHGDFAYYEKPGAGHWWGNQCMDWPPLFEFLKQRTRPAPDSVERVTFVTVDPRASATSHWATIVSQLQCLMPSKIDLTRLDETISGTTRNVARLTLTTATSDDVQVDLDGQQLTLTPDADGRIHLLRRGEDWTESEAPPLDHKGPHRGGPFRDAFNNRVQLVYGTAGTLEETARNAARARLDAERFWYRGNASLPIVADTAFDPNAQPDRNVVLYGNADTHAHWEALLGDSPIHIDRGVVTVGERQFAGDDLAGLFIRPRPGSDVASVGVVAGSGPVGDRLTEQWPMFFAGVGWPDFIVMDSSTLRTGVDGIIAAGFFDNAWSFDATQSAFGQRSYQAIP